MLWALALDSPGVPHPPLGWVYASTLSCLSRQLILSHISIRITCPVLPPERAQAICRRHLPRGGVERLAIDYLYLADQWVHISSCAPSSILRPGCPSGLAPRFGSRTHRDLTPVPLSPMRVRLGRLPRSGHTIFQYGRDAPRARRFCFPALPPSVRPDTPASALLSTGSCFARSLCARQCPRCSPQHLQPCCRHVSLSRAASSSVRELFSGLDGPAPARLRWPGAPRSRREAARPPAPPVLGLLLFSVG